MTETKPLHIWIIAGEPSGDALGAGLMAALRRQHCDNVRFSGIGGPLMESEGLVSLFSYSDLSVMGLVEVVPKIAGILRRIRQTVSAIKKTSPDVLITIDAPGFTLSVAKRLRGSNFPRLHYVAPTVWAWRPKRVHKFRRVFDHLLVLLPFEPPYFEAVGLPTTFVGHPVTEGGAASGDGAAFRARYQIPQHDLLVCVLPGSRTGEVRKLMPIFGDTVALLAAEYPGVRAVIPAVPSVEPIIRELAKHWSVAVRIVPALDDRFDAMAASDVAIAASGTVALELAAARLPTVIAYQISPITAWVVRRTLKVKYANLVNILLDQGVVPEMLQRDANPIAIEEALDRMISSSEHRNEILKAQDQAIGMLGVPADAGVSTPSDLAAKKVLQLIAGQK